ncbi:Pfs domain-containing protein [Mycena sanguinolenta]|uniref:Pfs domain-containing protein n=1 Tax=Mycena sanguinolenta TaxID=230812 RepID=A0A8H6WXX6_9AGAR|nr:Pfs domain-containing protein [Mycena sanguinolenta]
MTGYSPTSHPALITMKQTKRAFQWFHPKRPSSSTKSTITSPSSDHSSANVAPKSINPPSVLAQPPVIIYGGTGGRGGDGDIGGAGGTGGGPIVNFMTNTKEKLEKWLLSPPEMTQKQHDTEQLRSEGTGQWFLEDGRFIEWQNDPGVLWIEGPSGAGKSVISSMVIKELFSKRAEFPAYSCAVSFFYFDFRNKETQSLEIALRRLLLQLSAQSPCPYKTLDKQYKLSAGQKLPSYQDLVSLLLKLLHELGRTYVVLDALDECDSTNFEQLVGLVSQLKAWTETPLHLYITSQPRAIFTKGFADVNHIVLYSDTVGQDIKLFVANELHTNTALNAWQPSAGLVTERITLKSKGMFRLAACLLTELSCCLWGEDEELDQILERLPNDLFGIYDRFIYAIPKEHFIYVEAALRWIMFNEGSLLFDTQMDLTRLGDAVAFDFSNAVQYTYKPTRRRSSLSAMPKWLAGLIQYDNHTLACSITLAHASVQEYLLSDHFREKFNSNLSEKFSHAFISQCCISYLLHFRDQPLESGTDHDLRHKYPLGQYAAGKWYHHMTQSDEQETLLSLGMQLLQDGSKQYEALYHLNGKPEYVPPLYLCCSQGYLECVSQLIEKGAEINPANARNTPLSVASYCGKIDIVHLLLAKGADVDLFAVEDGTALIAACLGNELEIVQLLLEKGANINMVSGEYGSPLATNAYWGNLDIIQILLEKGANINLVGGVYGSPLGAASYRGNLDIVQFLIEKGANVNLAGGEFGSPLAAASYTHRLDIVQILLEEGANVDLVGGEYGSPLAAASASSSCFSTLDMVQLLLKKGADVNLVGGEYGNPLAAASYHNRLDVVQALLNNGADINLIGGHYGSPLVAASYRGNLDIVQLLLEKGANVNLADEECGTILAAASYGGRLDIVQLLLEKGVNVNLDGGKYGSPLAAASSSYLSNLNVVQLLLEKGADVNLVGGEYGSPLTAASYHGRLDIVQLLLKKGANINLIGGHYGSPLVAASRAYICKWDIVQLLLEKGANVNQTVEESGRILAAASYEGRLNIVQLLLENGVNVNLDGGKYGSSLAAAASSYTSNLNIVQLLLEKGADVNLVSGEYDTPLIAASYHGKVDIVQLLLKEGADVNLIGGHHGSPLVAASRSPTGNLDIVQLLLENGANVNVVGGEFGSPLATASHMGRLNIVKLLLKKGADVNLAGGEYGSPLAAASASPWGYQPTVLVHILLESGADVKSQGGHALKEALKKDYKAVVALLQEYGAVLDEEEKKKSGALLQR